jgi:predicted transcriptional regulator of viral defense system
LLHRQGLARSKELEALGLGRSQIQRLREAGVLVRVQRGFYRLADRDVGERSGLVEVARRVPKGVFCLLTALRFHGMTTQNPPEVWLAVTNRGWRPKLDYPPLRLVYRGAARLEQGVERQRVEGVQLRVYGPAQTVVDCFQYRNKVGLDVALEALREYRRLYPKGLTELWRIAQNSRMGRVIRPYLEAQS